MPYYLFDITELPYPHGMGARGENSNCPFAISTLRRKLRKPVHWSPGPQGYRELFNDEALLLRARNCDVHQDDWAVVLPAVVAFLAASPRPPTRSPSPTPPEATHGLTASPPTTAAWRWRC